MAHVVKWAGGLEFVGQSESGHSIVLDGDKAKAMSPMETMLLSVGTCACIDLVMILEKARQKVVDCWVELDGERREEMPQYYTRVEMKFFVKGVQVKEQHVKRAIDLAMEKYCSASAQVAALAEITTSYEILEADL
ncbi:OsmC family protein [Temperatibacter marinus]|uniref:OsmC family protein n=1 Tax=Temperatibacter marinus TaxID=1456591 RepID=A0AA52ECT3_9PROT|nr:OsmC family protein [Temperatibacter marinus]WND03062.1 OsmC family protein [Temperatibacter marinus]